MAARAGVVSGLVLTCPARPPGGALFRAYLGGRFDVGCECFDYDLVHRFFSLTARILNRW